MTEAEWLAATDALPMIQYLRGTGFGNERMRRLYGSVWYQFRMHGPSADLVRDVVGNPFRPPPVVDPAWLAWQGGTVERLARAAYESCRLVKDTLNARQLTVLADALEDAGCGDAALLGHIRGPGKQLRECWAVDLLLNKS